MPQFNYLPAHFVPAKQHLSKLTASHFKTLNMQFANQSVVERIQAVDIIRPLGTELSQLQFSSGPFWTQKLKPTQNNVHLLSAAGSVPHAEPVLASLVVESKSYCKFSSSVILSLRVDSHVHPSRALKRRFDHLLVYLG